MPTEELSYTIPNDGQGHNGSQVELFLTYQVNPDDPSGPALVTAVSGTYDTLGPDGKVVDQDTVLGVIDPGGYGGNDNELFINPGTSTAPFVTGNGLSFKISNAADSNDGTGNVNFYSSGDIGGDTLYSELNYDELFASSVTETAPCFVAGTRLRSANGEVAVETLACGDLVMTSSGELVPIVWIGNWRVDPAEHLVPRTVRPVRVARGALGDNVPSRDLYVSPDHALYLDGVLVPAHLLINGQTITQPEQNGVVTYYHIQVEPHDILLAEGAAVESFLDLGANGFFKPGEEPRSWEDACAPLLLTGPRLTRIQQALEKRAENVCCGLIAS